MITGAAGAVGAAVAAAVKRAGGVGDRHRSCRWRRHRRELDATAEADWQRVTADIERQHGRLDGLANAAGVVVLGSVEQLDFASWRRVLSVNLDGAFLGCKYSFPLLRKKGGSIVNLSSVSGLVGGQSRRLQCLQGRAVAAHQIRRAHRRAPQAVGALQCRLPGVPEGPMVESIAQATRAIPTLCIRSC